MSHLFSKLYPLQKRWTQLPVRHRGTIIILIPALCLAMTVAAWVRSRQLEIEVDQNINQTEAVLAESNGLLMMLLNAETGVRGYRLSQDEQFLQPYELATQDLPLRLSTLEQLLQGESQQNQRLRQIKRWVEQRMTILDDQIAKARTDPAGSIARDNSLLYQGKAAMDQLRILIAVLQQQEQQVLNRQRKHLMSVQQTISLFQWFTAGISVLSFLAAVYLFRQLDRNLTEREHQLRDSRDLVAARVEELSRLSTILVKTNTDLEKRNQELDQFAYIAAHDLKAPLRAIANLSEWIEEDLQGQLPPENQQHMQLLRGRVYRMETLLNRLLDYARIGRRSLPIETVNVALLLQDVITDLSPPATFTIEIMTPLPTLRTKRILLYQVFFNLIDNAIRHHDREKGHVQISAQSQGKAYEFTVRDDGPGIEPRFHHKIFAMFQTLEARDKVENMGAGLAIAKKIIEDEGRTIALESQIDQGATFRFILPQL